MADDGISGTLTDGEGIGTFTVPKIVKDLIVDILLGAAAGLAAVQIIDIPANVEQATIAGFAVATAIIAGVYRAVLKWAQTA